MAITASILKDLANTGCNIYIEDGYTASSIKEIALIIKTKGTHMTIKGNNYQGSTLIDLAITLGKQLTIIA